MAHDNKLDTIHELEAKNWNLTLDVELKKQRIRHLNQVLQNERDDAEETAAELDQKQEQLLESEQKRVVLEEKLSTAQLSLEKEIKRAEIREL